MLLSWGDGNSHVGTFNFYPIFIPLFGHKVSGVSVQASRWPEQRQFNRNRNYE